MKKFVLSAFICFVGFNIIFVSFMFHSGGNEKLGTSLLYIGLLVAIVALINSLNYWKEWNDREQHFVELTFFLQARLEG